MKRNMKIAMIASDSREVVAHYSDPDPSFGTAPAALLEGLAKMPECEVHVVSCVQKPFRSPEKLAENIYYHSLLVPKWGWLRGGYLGCIHAVREKLREIKPDLVHGQGTERYCALAAVRSGFPNVLTIHGNMRRVAAINKARPFSFLWLAAWLERIALPQTGGVICNSDYTRSQVSALAKKTWLVPNALQERFFAPAEAKPSAGVPVLLNIGAITSQKAQMAVLDIARRLHERKCRFEIHFIGKLDQSSSYGAAFREKITEAEKIGYAKYLGWKSPEELIGVMDAAMGMVHLSLEESFGLVVAEGLARNLKFFGLRVGGVVDVTKGVEGAELFNPGDFAALEEAVIKWLAAGCPKPSGGMERMCERYHPEVIAHRHLEIYGEVLARRKSSARV
jgi:glycosyltransferase involved in cell wall biosynthesis